VGYLNGSWLGAAGAESQVAMLFFNGGAINSMNQALVGATTLNTENHILTGQEAVGQLFTFVGRLGIQSLAST